MVALPEFAVPIVAAPMAGGVSTPELVAAVSEAGGLGFLAGGYLSPTTLGEQMTAVREGTVRPFGVNLFVPPARPVPDRSAAVARYADEIGPEAAALDVGLGDPRNDDDRIDEKIAVLAAHPPAAISLTFALPGPDRFAALRATGAALVATVTSPEEARDALELGVDALCAQGIEAGGHRGVHADPGGDPGAGGWPVRELVDAVRAVTDRPVIAAGGLADAAAVADVRRRGATAAQVGTALLRCPEAGTSDTHRAALADPARRRTAADHSDAGTELTRAFTGRPARALRTGFAARHGATAPAAYPELHHLTRPLRAAAAAAGDADRLHLWAGTGWAGAAAEPAARIVARLLD